MKMKTKIGMLVMVALVSMLGCKTPAVVVTATDAGLDATTVTRTDSGVTASDVQTATEVSH